MSASDRKIAVLTVFTSDTARGNAAAVVLTPERLSFAERTKLGVELADPATATVFISHPTLLRDLDGADLAAPRPTMSWTRFNGQPLPLCGHGTAAGVLYLLNYVLKHTPRVTFDYFFGDTAETEVQKGEITALKEGDKFGIDLPAAHPPLTVTEDERAAVEAALLAATGVEAKDVVAVSASVSGYNGDGLTRNVIIQLSPAVDLAGLRPDFPHLTNLPFRGIWLTSAWPTPRSDSAFRSRIFFPKTGLLEDNACGSAHTFLVPWWVSMYPDAFAAYRKDDGKYRVTADQPSPNGARIEIEWDGKWREDGGRTILLGEGIVLKE